MFMGALLVSVTRMAQVEQRCGLMCTLPPPRGSPTSVSVSAGVTRELCISISAELFWIPLVQVELPGRRALVYYYGG